DQQPVRSQEQRVVPPTGLAQRRQHVRPHGLMAATVLRQSGSLDPQKETAPHASEVVVVDVVRVERGRRAEDDLPVLADRALTELAGLELFPLRPAVRSGPMAAAR